MSAILHEAITAVMGEAGRRGQSAALIVIAEGAAAPWAASVLDAPSEGKVRYTMAGARARWKARYGRMIKTAVHVLHETLKNGGDGDLEAALTFVHIAALEARMDDYLGDLAAGMTPIIILNIGDGGYDMSMISIPPDGHWAYTQPCLH